MVWEDVALQLQGRRYNGAGESIGNQFQISTTYDGTHPRPQMLQTGWDGRVAVVWEDPEESGEGSEIRGRACTTPARIHRVADPQMNPTRTRLPSQQPDSRRPESSHRGRLRSEGFSGDLGERHQPRRNDDLLKSVQARVMTGQNTFDGTAGPVQHLDRSANQNVPRSGRMVRPDRVYVEKQWERRHRGFGDHRPRGRHLSLLRRLRVVPTGQRRHPLALDLDLGCGPTRPPRLILAC